jgi:hypothetical protein
MKFLEEFINDEAKLLILLFSSFYGSRVKERKEKTSHTCAQQQ